MKENEKTMSSSRCPFAAFLSSDKRRREKTVKPVLPARLPPGPRGVPIVGSLFRYFRDPARFLLEAARCDRDVAYYRLGGQHIFQIGNPDVIKGILHHDPERFDRTGAVVRAKRFTGEGLLALEGAAHARHRRLVQPLFSKSRIEGYKQAIRPVVDAETTSWRAGDVVNITEFFNELSLRVFVRTFFGVTMEGEAAALRDAISVCLLEASRSLAPWEAVLRRGLWWRHRRFRSAQSALDGFIRGLIAARRRRPTDDFVSTLLRVQREQTEDAPLTDGEIRDELMTFLLAGTETVATALNWTLYLLAAHPAVAGCLVREIEAPTAKPDASADGDPSYLDMVIKESLRLFPPVPGFARKARADYDVLGYRVPAASVIGISPYAIHHDPRFYPDPFRFDPLRWTRARESSRPKLSFIPFGAGPRVCIGAGFAIAEMNVVIASLLKNWAFRLVPGQRIRFAPLFTLRPKKGIRLLIDRRGDAARRRNEPAEDRFPTPTNGDMR